MRHFTVRILQVGAFRCLGNIVEISVETETAVKISIGKVRVAVHPLKNVCKFMIIGKTTKTAMPSLCCDVDKKHD